MNFHVVPIRSIAAKMRSSRWSGVWAFALWIAAIGAGFALLAEFDSTAGAAGESPGNWPGETGIVRAPGRASLLMFAHPRCPCTRASLTELARIAAEFPDQVDVRIFFRLPETESAGWMNTDRWQQACEIPGVEVAGDPNGNLASRFGAKTSGHVLLYDGSGRLLYSGGITAARAREGESPGGETVLALLRGRATTPSQNAVFGCPLFDACPPGTEGATCPTR